MPVSPIPHTRVCASVYSLHALLQVRRLQRRVKRETKGAAREIQRDVVFLARVRGLALCVRCSSSSLRSGLVGGERKVPSPAKGARSKVQGGHVLLGKPASNSQSNGAHGYRSWRWKIIENCVGSHLVASSPGACSAIAQHLPSVLCAIGELLDEASTSHSYHTLCSEATRRILNEAGSVNCFSVGKNAGSHSASSGVDTPGHVDSSMCPNNLAVKKPMKPSQARPKGHSGKLMDT